MTQIEIDINALKSSLKTIETTIGLLGSNVPQAIIDQKNSILAEIAQKQALLSAQKQESIYEHLARIVGYSTDLKSCIENTIDKLLDSTISNATDPGLLLGKIQCGKTRAFVGVMGLAFDKGIDACVVLTKPDDGLVEQTISRMEYEFRDYLDNTNLSRTVIEVHKIGKGMNFTQAQIDNQKNIFVVHKNTTRLNYLVNLFSKPGFVGKKVLVIDDEADFVSRAFYTSNGNTDAGRIALLIDQFMKIPAYSRYLQVTATPYSLFLQPDHTVQVNNGTVEPFRPRFTTLVPIHANYVGGKQYFIESQNTNSMYSYLFHKIDDKCMDHLLNRNKDKRVYGNAQSSQILYDLRYALMTYFVGSAIRQLQEAKLSNSRYNTSFFLHVSVNKEDHEYEERVVNHILNYWKNDIVANGLSNIQNLFDIVFSELEDSLKAGNDSREIDIFIPQKSDVETKVVRIFQMNEYSVQIVNSSTKSQNLLGRDGQLKLKNCLNIFIGGFKLDRGITIDHLLGFLYGRRPNTKQADAVLQHHRMYGNRAKEDMAVTRLHTTQDLYDTMKWIDNMDHQLRKIFINAMKDPNASIPQIAIEYSRAQGVMPCNRGKLAISDLDTFDSFKRITTFGFQTGSASAIKPIVDGIDKLLQNEPGYQIGTPFLLKKAHAYQLLKDIRSTFIYNRTKDNNAGMDWNEDEMIAAMEKYIPQDGKVWCYVATNRNMSRIRQNGNFVDAPEDGNTDTPIARTYANGRPVLMLLRQNGDKNKGWRDAPFYWPSLRLPLNIESCIYCK